MHLSVLLTTIFVLLPVPLLFGSSSPLAAYQMQKNVFVTIPPTRVNRQIGDDPRRLPTQRGALTPLDSHGQGVLTADEDRRRERPVGSRWLLEPLGHIVTTNRPCDSP